MARIAGINIPMNKHVWVGLTHIYGVGRARARSDLRGRGRQLRRTKVKDLTEAEVDAIRSQIAKFAVEGDLRREVSMNIKRLMDLGTWRGMRHRRGSAGARPAHAHQCAHPQGAAQAGGQAERAAGQGVTNR